MTHTEWLEQRAEAAIRAEGRLPYDVFVELQSAGLDGAAIERRLINLIEQEQCA